MSAMVDDIRVFDGTSGVRDTMMWHLMIVALMAVVSDRVASELEVISEAIL